MRCCIGKIPDYDRLCEMSKRLPALDPAAVHATATLHAVGGELAASLQSSLAMYGISEGRLRILGLLMDHDRPATHTELAEWSGVTAGTITGLIDGLERDRYVVRKASETDRRVILIEMTPAGQKHLDAILPGHLTRLSRMMSRLSKAEQRTLVKLLLKVRGGLPALWE